MELSRSVRDETKVKFNALLKASLVKGVRNKSKSSQNLLEDDRRYISDSSGDDILADTESTESSRSVQSQSKTDPKLNSKSTHDLCEEKASLHEDSADNKNFLLNRFLNAEEYTNSTEVIFIKDPPIPKPRKSKLKSSSDASNNTYSVTSATVMNIVKARDESPSSNHSARTYDIGKSELIGDILIHGCSEENVSGKLSVVKKISRSQMKHQRIEKVGSNADGVRSKNVIELQPIGYLNNDQRSSDQAEIISHLMKGSIANAYENSAESASYSKQEAIELQPMSSQVNYENETEPKPKARTKIKGQVKSNLVKNIYNYDAIISITVHKTDELKLNSLVEHPVVKVHVVNTKTGEYLKKTDNKRAAIFYFENTDVTYLLPVITRNFNLQTNRCLHAEWEETIIINEDFKYLTDPGSEVIIFFEILDFMSFSAANLQAPGASQGWHKIAWAFLKIVGKNNVLNVDKKLRLQLYHPCKPSRVVQPKCDVFSWWQVKKFDPYPCTIYVTVKEMISPDEVVKKFRYKTPLQQEGGSLALDNGLNVQEVHPNCSNDLETSGDTVILPRFKHKSCKLPNKLLTELDTEREGCFVLKFSHSGLLLACSILLHSIYTIAIYSVLDYNRFHNLPSHQGLVYNITWSKDDSLLVAASADGTVSIWDTKKLTFLQMLPHPSYVYWCEIDNNTMIATCCYDSILRIWTPDSDSKSEFTLHDELEAHEGYVTCACFGHQSNLMFSSDSVGGIVEWKIDNEENWYCARKIKIFELKEVVINQIILHKKENRLIVHARDSVVRIVDVKDECVIHWLEGASNNRVRTLCCVTACFTYVLAGSENGILHVWNFNTGNVVASYHPYTNFSGKDLPIHCVDFNSEQNMLAFSHYGHQVPIKVYINEQLGKSEVDLRFTSDPVNTHTDSFNRLAKDGKRGNTEYRIGKSVTKLNLQHILEKMDKILG